MGEPEGRGRGQECDPSRIFRLTELAQLYTFTAHLAPDALSTHSAEHLRYQLLRILNIKRPPSRSQLQGICSKQGRQRWRSPEGGPYGGV